MGILILLLSLFIQFHVNAQERIPMELNELGIYTIPCEINGIKLRFSIDMGKMDAYISSIDAAFMLKNGYITKNDIIGKVKNSKRDDGSIPENSMINLKVFKIGNLLVKDVNAYVSSEIKSSLILGRSAVQMLGDFSIDGNDLLLYDSKPTQFTDKYLSDNEFEEIVDTLAEADDIINWPNGDTYKGELVNGIMEGKGTYTWANGVKYVGQWRNGKKHGFGTIYYTDNNKYIGNWINDIAEGYGVMYFDGNTYVGEWKNFKFNGKGLYFYADGGYSKGTFVDDKLDGKGTLVTKEGYIYTGTWKQDKLHGYCTVTHPDGKKETEYWENGTKVSTK